MSGAFAHGRFVEIQICCDAVEDLTLFIVCNSSPAGGGVKESQQRSREHLEIGCGTTAPINSQPVECFRVSFSVRLLLLLED